MAVIIGHASIDERGGANSGQAGDRLSYGGRSWRRVRSGCDRRRSGRQAA